jgi:hypothetical protein
MPETSWTKNDLVYQTCEHSYNHKAQEDNASQGKGEALFWFTENQLLLISWTRGGLLLVLRSLQEEMQ